MFQYSGLITLILAGSLSAAPYYGSSQGFRDWLGNSRGPSLGLIDPSRLSVSHNVSMGFSSGGGNSLMQSMYTSQFAYRLSDPVHLSFLLGAQNTQLIGAPGYPGSFNSMIGGVALDYMPTPNTHFRFEVMQAPYLMNTQSFGNRFWAGNGNR